MQEIERHPKNRRGSSPPFQEMEKWADDGANGSHWVKIGVATLREGAHRRMGRLVPEETVLTKTEDESRWEDDGGRNMSAPPDDAQIIFER
jgi:hypothetical protein